MTLLHLIRHGAPVSGWRETGGSPDPGLSAVGHAQAAGAAEALAGLPQEERPTRIVSSPLRRCRETARPLEARLAQIARIDPAVAEIPTPPGMGDAARAPWLRAAMAGEWREIAGIDGSAWRASVVEALLQAQGAAVFTHFVAINAAVSAALRMDGVVAFRPAPGSITTLRIQGSRLELVRLGDALKAEGPVL